MVNLRRKHIQVKAERRSATRIELHIPVVILGVDTKAQIVDFSLDGFHIELGTQTALEVGRHINLALRVPFEKGVIKIRAVVVYKDEKGIGCRFINLTTQNYDLLERSFNIFNSTLPID